MIRTALSLALVAIGAAMQTAFVNAQDASVGPKPDPAVIRTSHSAFRASIQRIERRSALWRAAAEAVRRSGRHAIVLTPDQVIVADSLAGENSARFDPATVAAAAPVPDEGSRVRVVLVVVNLSLIEQVHRSKRSLPGEVDADIDRILVHEIYGHAFPYLLAGDLSGRCPDPVANQEASHACAIRRENAVRKELGLGTRITYGLDGLALARSF